MKKKLLSVVLSTAMVASLLVGCGSKTEEAPAATDAATDEATDAATDEEADVELPEDTGKVLNIYCWNDEFANRLKDHYPGYEANDPDDALAGGKIGDVEVKFTSTPSTDNAYQNNLDATLPGNADAAADDKVDMFLVEADYALKYVNTDLCMSVADLGIKDSELANQYQYTKDIMTDTDGNLKGLSWQGCPGVLIYNREAAKEVFGADDPDTVQAKVSDWATFNATAAEMKEAGYKMTATTNDTFRTYSNNVTTPWVVDGKIQIDDNLKAWVDASKEMADNGYCGTQGLWSDDWSKGFYPEGKVFCYFGPAWLINFSMAADTEGSIANAGGWGACEGPQGFYWGGTWITADTSTADDTAASDFDTSEAISVVSREDGSGTRGAFIELFGVEEKDENGDKVDYTTDEAIMTDIVKADSDFVNNKPAMEAAAQDDSYAFPVLGGQNPLAMFCAGADKISLSNITEYDQGCNEEFQNAMTGYFDGNYATYDEALEAFYTAVTEKYPELTY